VNWLGGRDSNPDKQSQSPSAIRRSPDQASVCGPGLVQAGSEQGASRGCIRTYSHNVRGPRAPVLAGFECFHSA